MDRRACYLMAAALLLGGADVATAQDRVAFAVDGDHRDWGGWALDDHFDVTPDTNSTVDIINYDFGRGEYGPGGDQGPPKRELFAFIFKFLAPPFQGSDPMRVDLYFDVAPDTTFGDPTAPWTGFRPEYRVTVAGREGSLTTESCRRYTGGQWDAPTEGPDIPELEVALSGQWLEGAIPWATLGSPAPPEDPDESLAFRWAVQVSKGEYREYVPDGTSSPFPWDPFTEYLTNIEARSWGQVKNR